MNLTAVACVIVGAGWLTSATPADAAHHPLPAAGDETLDASGSVSDRTIGVVVGTGGGAPATTAPSASVPPVVTCVLIRNDERVNGQIALQGWGTPTRVRNGFTERMYFRQCSDGTVTITWRVEPTAVEVANVAFQKLTRQLPEPQLGMEPDELWTIPKYDNWIWTTTPFQPVAVTLTVEGVSSTVTAVPYQISFDPAEPDGTTLICAGPGKPWLDVYPRSEPTPCKYSYYHASSIDPAGTFPTRLQLWWNVTWTTNQHDGETTLDPAYLTTTTNEITVAEVQILVTQ